MQIVHVANFGFRAKGAFQHSVAPKLSNGLIRNGHCVVNFSDREVARSSSFLGHSKFGIAAVNNKLRQFCREVEPELLLLGHADLIAAETVAAIRRDLPHLRVAQWNVDPLFEEDNVRRIISKLDVVDATLVSTAGKDLAILSRPGKRVAFLPNPVDFSVERGQNHVEAALPFDFFYACGNPREPLRHVCGRYWDMEEFVSQILAALPHLRPMLAGLLGRPHLVGAAYQKALEASALGLNISRRNDVLLYTSDRLAHMIGNGQAILIERATGYDRLFSDNELAFFSSVDELVAQLRTLAADPARRQALAAAGRRRYHELFNEQRVARYICDVAFERLDVSQYPWSTLE